MCDEDFDALEGHPIGLNSTGHIIPLVSIVHFGFNRIKMLYFGTIRIFTPKMYDFSTSRKKKP